MLEQGEYFFFYKRPKGANFKIDDIVLKWDTWFKEKGEDGNFDHLWKRTYRIVSFHGNNTFIL